MSENINISENFNCRICHSTSVENFRLNNLVFSSKNKNWKSFYCLACGGVSDYQIKGKEINYTDGSYRSDKKTYNLTNSNNNDISVPLDFWSFVSFKRWIHIYEIFKKNNLLTKSKKIKLLDYGGYNGFLIYALAQKIDLDPFLAELDTRGLEIAKFLGIKTINLNSQKIEHNQFDMITVVHVMEHLDSPQKDLEILKNSLKDKGVIYIEVPNLYGFPLSDNAHKIAFSASSLSQLLQNASLKVLDQGYTSTPEDSVKFDYFLSNKKENLYILAMKDKANQQTLNFKFPKSIKNFKFELYISYAKILMLTVAPRFLKISLKFIKRFFLYFIYGFSEYLTLKLFRFALISKILKKKNTKS